jgi:adenylate kinase family enzyme
VGELQAFPWRRVRVVGTSGSGKTTLARDLARRLDCDHVELDECQHGPAWEQRSREQFQREVRARIAAAPDGRWVMCGNYLHQAPLDSWPVDAVVWLDLPRALVMWQVVTRTLRRIARREELWNGNRETVRGLWERDGIVRWAWRTHAANRERFGAMMAGAGAAASGEATAPWIRLRSRRAVRTWLARLDDQ